MIPTITAPVGNPQPESVTFSWTPPADTKAERWTYKVTKNSNGSEVVSQRSVNHVSGQTSYSVAHSLSEETGYTLWVRGEQGTPGVTKGKDEHHAPIWQTRTFTVASTPADTKAPTVNCVVPNQDTWYGENVSVPCTASDESGLASGSPATFTLTMSVAVGSEDAAAKTNSQTIKDIHGNQILVGPYTFKVDRLAPTASPSRSPDANADGWNNSDVTVSFTGTDGGSGIASCDAAKVLSTDGANQSASGICTDNAGNHSAPAAVSGINIDKTKPTVSLVGGPANGSSPIFGSVPAAPTCTASDALSGLDGTCTISGYKTTVGTHTVTATATDKAGNTETATLTYTVLPWALKGFYAPVDMKDAAGSEIINTIRAGQAVGLKFNVYAGTTEKTTTDAVPNFTAKQIACSASATTAPVEITNTGSTRLRYDATAAQFIQNWATPKTANSCYRVSIVTLDGSSLTAVFQTK